MFSGKFVWFVIVQFMIFKGCSCLNATENVTEEPLKMPNKTNTEVPVTEEGTPTVETTEFEEHITLNSSRIKNFFEDLKNLTIPMATLPKGLYDVTNTVIMNCRNESYVNLTCLEQLYVEISRSNGTMLTEIPELFDSSDGYSVSEPEKAAAIAAGVFLISAVVGYFSCVGYRQFLQRKYGNSQILIGDEVYDTSDLRYFEI